jgi:(p)ppGpp synthase/HD superfamily hydrolase
VIGEQGQQLLEVFCATEDEQANAEALLHQAAADEALRRDINARCNKEIGTIVDSVLKRATGG